MDNCIRRCCGCRQMKKKEELIRIVRDTDGEVFIDKSQKSDGRGAYVCKDKDCIKKVVKSKSLNNALHRAVPGSIYGKLETIPEELSNETG